MHGTFIIVASSFSGLSKFRRMPSSYLLLGLDFMVTADYRIWFIEANNYPLWPKGSPFINDLMDRLGVSSIKNVCTTCHAEDLCVHSIINAESSIIMLLLCLAEQHVRFAV